MNLNELSNEELNRRLAELVGFKWMRWGNHPCAPLFFVPPDFPPGSFVPAIRKPDEEFRADKLPSYCTDLNAVAIVEAGLTMEQGTVYANILWPMGYAVFNAITATASQRTFALIETLSAQP